MGYTSRLERVILRAGAMLIFSVLFQFQLMFPKELLTQPLQSIYTIIQTYYLVMGQHIQIDCQQTPAHDYIFCTYLCTIIIIDLKAKSQLEKVIKEGCQPVLFIFKEFSQTNIETFPSIQGFDILSYTQMQASNLIAQQKGLLQKVLTSSKTSSSLWRILIFDRSNHELISSQLKMRDLRQVNITLYFNIKETRQALHGVTAVYLVEPNLENVEHITNDFCNNLYSNAIITFSSQPTNHILSTLAKGLSKKCPSQLSKIQKVQYCPLSFEVLGSQFALLRNTQQICNFISNISVKKNVLFINTPKQAEKIQHLKDRLEGQMQDCQQNEVTLFLHFNRETDLFPSFAHGLSYAGLIECLYDFDGRHIKGCKGNEVFQVSLDDDIWVDRMNKQISELDLEKEFNKIKSKLINLNSMMEEYTLLTQKNKKIEEHLKVAEMVLREASQRKLNQLHQLELEIYMKRSLTKDSKKDLQRILEDKNMLLEDKSRLLIIYVIYMEPLNRNELEALQSLYPAIKSNNMYNELKLKKYQSTPQSNRLQKLTHSLTKNIITALKFQQEKYVLTKLADRLLNLQSIYQIQELGYEHTAVMPVPPRFKVHKLIIYVDGGGYFNEYQNLMKLQNTKVLYTSDRLGA